MSRAVVTEAHRRKGRMIANGPFAAEEIAQALADTRAAAEALGYVDGQTEGMESRNRAYARIAELEAERDRLADALKCAELGHQEGRV